MSFLVAALAWTLWHSLWQLALVAGLAALALRVAGAGRPRTQYGLVLAALACCLVLPVLTFLHGLAREAVPVLAEAARSGPVPWSPAAVAPLPAPATWAARWPVFLAAHAGGIAGAWALGALVLTAWRACGWLLARRWCRAAWLAPAPRQAAFQALALRLGAGRRVVLRVSNRVATPMAMGLWRPVVLVPAALLTQLPEAYLEALLAHELAHVARADYLVNWLQSLVEVLGFHHPAVWWLSRRARTLREHLCDDRAAAAIGEPRRLALALDALDDFQPLLKPMALAAAGGPLFERIQRLVRPRTAASSWNLWPLMALLAPGAALALQAGGRELPPIPVAAEAVALVDAVAAQEGLDPQLLRSIAWVESGFNPKAQSPAGATGLLQVLPATARQYGASDLGDPRQVAAAGARYLKALLASYGGDVAQAVAAYNCGRPTLDAGQAGTETAAYRALVLEVLRAKAVQPAPTLADGGLDGTLRRQADGKTWTIQGRVRSTGTCRLTVLPDVQPGLTELAPYCSVEMVNPVSASWKDWDFKLHDRLPPDGWVRVRATLVDLGWTGETRVRLQGGWGTFAFRLQPTK